MAVVIADELLRQANLTEDEARIEIACGLYDSGRLALESAAGLAQIDPDHFKSALGARGISIRGLTDSQLDEAYEVGYKRLPEDPSETAALVAHLPVTTERWE
jgi:predicted HTH domain antitoxin